ncbi:hypothetical protein KBY24_19340 [Ruegeria pomeroyi]|nr:hypothetical protein [Ruegeria pomeroyi]
MDAEPSILAVEQFANRARLIRQGGAGLSVPAWGFVPLICDKTAARAMLPISDPV